MPSECASRMSALSNSVMLACKLYRAGVEPPRSALCISDVDLFRYFDGVIDVDAEVTNGALDLRVAE